MLSTLGKLAQFIGLQNLKERLRCNHRNQFAHFYVQITNVLHQSQLKLLSDFGA